MRNSQQRPFFVNSEKALLALPYWLAEKEYDTIIKGHKDKRQNDVINIELRQGNLRHRGEHIPGVIVRDQSLYTRTLEIVEANKVVGA